MNTITPLATRRDDRGGTLGVVVDGSGGNKLNWGSVVWGDGWLWVASMN